MLDWLGFGFEEVLSQDCENRVGPAVRIFYSFKRFGFYAYSLLFPAKNQASSSVDELVLGMMKGIKKLTKNQAVAQFSGPTCQ